MRIGDGYSKGCCRQRADHEQAVQHRFIGRHDERCIFALDLFTNVWRDLNDHYSASSSPSTLGSPSGVSTPKCFSASFAALCSASFLLFPVPAPVDMFSI